MPRSLDRSGIRVTVFPSREEAELAAADRIAVLLEQRRMRGLSVVLGLATGRTPIGIYRELVARQRRREISFAHAETFNLDEYWPIDLKAKDSFHRFMHEHLFDHVDIPRGKRHVPNGSLEEPAIAAHCDEYEAAIRRAGGIDLQLLGIGRNGHVGFNEPGSESTTRTRLVALTEETLADNRPNFADAPAMPKHAITMGIATILEARDLLVLAFGPKKAEIVHAALMGPIGARVPASFLRSRNEGARVDLYVDEAAAARL